VTLTGILQVVLTLTSLLLTIAVLGLLRMVAEARLTLATGPGRRSEPGLLQIGNDSELPAAVTAESGPGRQVQILAVLSGHCASCRVVAEALSEVDWSPIQVALLDDDGGGQIRALLGDNAEFLSPAATTALREAYGINRAPVLIFHGDGKVLTSGQDNFITTTNDIADLYDLAASGGREIGDRAPEKERAATK
jgi:hypothetical protein